MDGLTHLDKNGQVKMVDVSQKEQTQRHAAAQAVVQVNPSTFTMIREGNMKKGDVLAAARIAGILAAKHTWELIPLCHSVSLTGVDVDITLREEDCTVHIVASTVCKGETGVEMEAMTAASVAALTIYDMCKGVQRDISVGEICLLYKDGGKSGCYCKEEDGSWEK